MSRPVLTGLVGLLLVSPLLEARPASVHTLRTQRVGDVAYFHVFIKPPADLVCPVVPGVTRKEAMTWQLWRRILRLTVPTPLANAGAPSGTTWVAMTERASAAARSTVRGRWAWRLLRATR